MSEDRADELLRAAKAEGDVPPHPSVGERVWKGVESGLRPKPPVPKTALGVGATVIVAAGLLYYYGRPATPRGEVATQETPAAFEVGDTRVVIGPRSVFVFITREQHALKRGSVNYDSTRSGVALTLSMGKWTATVQGSRFHAQSNDKESVIEVFDGSVRLHTGERDIELRAGETFREGGEEAPTLDRAIGTPASDRAAPASRETPATVHEPETPPPKRELTLADALERVRAGKYTEAETIYRRIAERSPRDAEVALYALAKMKTHKQQAPAQGLAILDELDRRFPRGELRQERMLTRIEVLFRTARCDEAKQAMETYVKQYTHAIESLREIDASQCVK